MFQILKLLAKQISDQEKENDAFCVTTAARPLLSYGSRTVRGNRRTFLYAEALRKFNQEVKKLNLQDIYKRAKPTYAGKMQHTFAILKEDGPDPNLDLDNAASGSNAEPIGERVP
jgi:hypothetical protein